MKKFFLLILSCIVFCSCHNYSTTEDVTKDTTEDVTKDTTEDVTKDTTEDVTEDTTEDVTIGFSPNNPVPLGEYIQVPNKKADVKMKLVNVQEGSDDTIVIMNIEISNLKPGKSYDLLAFDILLNNGLTESSQEKIAYTKNLGIPYAGSVVFGADGSTDFYVRFPCKRADCKTLAYSYKGLLYDECLYFSLK